MARVLGSASRAAGFTRLFAGAQHRQHGDVRIRCGAGLPTDPLPEPQLLVCPYPRLPRPPPPCVAAPEQLLGSPCTLAADVYSLGMLLIVLASRRLLSNRGEWALPQAPRDCPAVSGCGRTYKVVSLECPSCLFLRRHGRGCTWVPIN